MSWEGILRLPGAPRRCSLEPWTRIRFAPWYAVRRPARKPDEPALPLQVLPSCTRPMPELPEVETTCRGVRPHVEGRVLSALVVRNARLRQPVPPDLAHEIEGRVLLGVSRRAKYLLFDFGHGSLIVHLGMSGSLRVVASTAAPGTHDHVDLVFGAQALRLRDPRRFGLVCGRRARPRSIPCWHGWGRSRLMRRSQRTGCIGSRGACVRPSSTC